MPARKEDIPSTLERSPDKVQRTYEKALDRSHEAYDDEQAAHRAGWASVNHVAEKNGDHCEPNDEYGPSDPRAEQSRAEARAGFLTSRAPARWLLAVSGGAQPLLG